VGYYLRVSWRGLLKDSRLGGEWHILERAFREVRRKTRPRGFFLHAGSAEKIFNGGEQRHLIEWVSPSP